MFTGHGGPCQDGRPPMVSLPAHPWNFGIVAVSIGPITRSVPTPRCRCRWHLGCGSMSFGSSRMEWGKRSLKFPAQKWEA